MAQMSRRSGAPSTPVTYGPDIAILRLLGDIETETVFSLCDEVDLAIDYYKYRKIMIEVESSGGQISSLDYYISKRSNWKSAGIGIRTRALTTASSAAAYIFVLGDIGSRSAYPSSRIVLHFGQTGFVDNASVTQDELERSAIRLRDMNQRFMTMVVDQVMEELDRKRYHYYPVLFDKSEEHDLKQLWDKIGIQREDVQSATHRWEHVQRVIRAVHVFGEAIEPRLAKSLLLIDDIEMPSSQGKVQD